MSAQSQPQPQPAGQYAGMVVAYLLQAFLEMIPPEGVVIAVEKGESIGKIMKKVTVYEFFKWLVKIYGRDPSFRSYVEMAKQYLDPEVARQMLIQKAREEKMAEVAKALEGEKGRKWVKESMDDLKKLLTP